MKTLVIHPEDPTTDFLSPIYEGRDWTVMRKRKSKSDLKEQIKSHDRIIMLGHGTRQGLIGEVTRQGKYIVDYNYYIDATIVYLLRGKKCVAIWCNADVFVRRYELKGFFTGMIISEYEEAMMYAVSCNSEQIRHSNSLFADAVKRSLDSENIVSEINDIYKGDNPIILFNKENLYYEAVAEVLKTNN